TVQSGRWHLQFLGFQSHLRECTERTGRLELEDSSAAGAHGRGHCWPEIVDGGFLRASLEDEPLVSTGTVAERLLLDPLEFRKQRAGNQIDISLAFGAADHDPRSSPQQAVGNDLRI